MSYMSFVFHISVIAQPHTSQHYTIFFRLVIFFLFSRNKNNKNNKIMNSVLKWNTMLRKSLVEIHLTLLCFA